MEKLTKLRKLSSAENCKAVKRPDKHEGSSHNRGFLDWTKHARILRISSVVSHNKNLILPDLHWPVVRQWQLVMDVRLSQFLVIHKHAAFFNLHSLTFNRDHPLDEIP